jgi:hypothetical protein
MHSADRTDRIDPSFKRSAYGSVLENVERCPIHFGSSLDRLGRSARLCLLARARRYGAGDWALSYADTERPPS